MLQVVLCRVERSQFSQRGAVVECFAAFPRLVMAQEKLLKSPVRQIEADAESADERGSVFQSKRFSRFADFHDQLGFIVQIAVRRKWKLRCIRRDERCDRLHEDDGIAFFVAEFADMFHVISSDAENSLCRHDELLSSVFIC